MYKQTHFFIGNVQHNIASAFQLREQTAEVVADLVNHGVDVTQPPAKRELPAWQLQCLKMKFKKINFRLASLSHQRCWLYCWRFRARGPVLSSPTEQSLFGAQSILLTPANTEIQL